MSAHFSRLIGGIELAQPLLQGIARFGKIVADRLLIGGGERTWLACVFR